MQQRSPSALTTLLNLAWPIILARATQSVVGFCDALMVAPLGHNALAATTTGALNTFAFIIFPFGTVFILQSFAAQLRGRGTLDAIPRYAYYGLLIAIFAGLLPIIGLPLLPWAFAKLGYSPEVRALLIEYMSIRALSVGAAVGAEAIGNWYGGLGNTRLSMVVGVTTMIINVIGCYVLIEPRFGLPGYGVAGSAWAAVIATWAGFFVALGALLTGAGYRDLLPPVKAPWRTMRRVEFLRVLRFGLPSGVNWFLEFSAFALFVNAIVTHLGTTTLAAFNVMIQINSVSFMPAFGLASAGAVLVGEAIGRRALDEVPRSVKLTIAVAAAWMLCVGTLYVLIPEHLVGLFTGRAGEDAGELLRIGTLMLMISAVWQMFDALGMTLSEALRAAGDTTWCMVARIVLAWGCFVPGAWFAIFVQHGGIGSVMIALASYIGLSSLAFGFRFLQGRWRNIDLVGAEPDLVAD